MRKSAASLRNSVFEQIARSHQRLGIAAAAAIIPLIGFVAAPASADTNTPQTVNNGATDLTVSTSYTPEITPTVSSDVILSAANYNPASFTVGLNDGSYTLTGIDQTFGSLNDLSATALNISNSQNNGPATITLGGNGDNGDEAPGSNSADLLYVATGANLSFTAGIGDSGLAVTLGQAGNLDIAGTATISSPITDGGANYGLTKTGAGTLILNGPSSNETGLLSVNGGTLNLTSLGYQQGYGGVGAGLAVGGGTFICNALQPQSFTGLTVNAGQSAVINGTTSQITLTLNAITPKPGGTVDFTTVQGSAGAYVVTTTTTNTNGILGGWATADYATTWAVGSASGTATAISGLSSYLNSTANTTSLPSTANVDVLASNTSPYVSQTFNSLRFLDAAAATLTLSGTNVISSGGILVTKDVANNLTTITGGTLAGSPGGSLYLNDWNTGNAVVISSAIGNNGGPTSFVKSGPGTAYLAVNNVFTGPVYVDGGTLEIQGRNANNGLYIISGVLNENKNDEAALGTGSINIGGSSGPAELYLSTGGNPIFTNAINIVGGANDTAGIVAGSGGATFTGLLTLSDDLTVNNDNGSFPISFERGIEGSGTFNDASTGTGGQVNITAGANPVNFTGTLENTSSGLGALLVSANLSGAESIVQNSANSITTLSGANTYSGTTTVAAGKLYLNGTHTGGGAYTIGGSGTVYPTLLGGTGSTASAVTAGTDGGLPSLATIQPGTSATPLGTLGTGPLTLNDGSTFVATVNSDTPSSSSLLSVSGAVTLYSTNGATLSVIDLGQNMSFVAGSVYTIISSTAPVSGTFAGLVNGAPITASNGSVYDVEYNYKGGDNVDLLSVSAAPEPSSLSLLAVGASSLMRRRRPKPVRTRKYPC